MYGDKDTFRLAFHLAGKAGAFWQARSYPNPLTLTRARQHPCSAQPVIARRVWAQRMGAACSAQCHRQQCARRIEPYHMRSGCCLAVPACARAPMRTATGRPPLRVWFRTQAEQAACVLTACGSKGRALTRGTLPERRCQRRRAALSTTRPPTCASAVPMYLHFLCGSLNVTVVPPTPIGASKQMRLAGATEHNKVG